MEYVDIDKLKCDFPHPINRKRLRELRKRLREGTLDTDNIPIFIDKEYNVYNNGVRFQYLKELGVKKVYCYIMEQNK